MKRPMLMRIARIAAVSISLIASTALATIVGSVRGVVRDAQNNPVAGATVVLKSRTSGWHQSATTSVDGAFTFQAVPIGGYAVQAESHDVTTPSRALDVTSGAAVTADLALQLTTASTEVDVTAAPMVDERSATTQTFVSRSDVQHTPGADRANSLAMITDFVPGAYVVHDQLHVRGGHQVEWLIDGVPVPNTNIATNVGPQFDPRDVDYLEAQRGGYSAEYGDRTYAVFNVVPRSGFERLNEAHLVLNYGSHSSTDDQINLGSHSDRFAYYTSLSANRTDLGLEPPVAQIIHDEARGAGMFTSLNFLPDDSNQLRMVASARADDYSIPNDQDLQAAGVRDQQRERDTFLNASWLRTISPSALLTVAPFFHANAADFEGGPQDPIVIRDSRRSLYAGAEGTLNVSRKGNDFSAGISGFGQRDSTTLALRSSDASFAQRQQQNGSVTAIFAEDRFDITPRLTVRAGVRYTRFDGAIRESALSPRAGVALRIGSNLVLRASFTDVYQPPPLMTVGGPVLDFAVQQGFGFLPLRGERDRSLELSAGTTAAGWNLAVSGFRNHARNFFDHDVLGNSNIFFPLTIDQVRIRALEASAQSPLLAQLVRVHFAYSHQTVEGQGGVSGGLTDFSPPSDERFFLDHDQRNTLSAGGALQLPRASWVSANMAYGSGFLNGDGPQHLPGHTSFDAAAGTTLGAFMIKLSVLNVTNSRYLIDNSNTFGGTHYNEPRSVMMQLEYQFRY